MNLNITLLHHESWETMPNEMQNYRCPSHTNDFQENMFIKFGWSQTCAIFTRFSHNCDVKLLNFQNFYIKRFEEFYFNSIRSIHFISQTLSNNDYKSRHPWIFPRSLPKLYLQTYIYNWKTTSTYLPFKSRP